MHGLQDEATFLVFIAQMITVHTHWQVFVHITIYWSPGRTQSWPSAIHMDHTT